jgi:amino acid transporter
VSRENLGETQGLVAGAALMVDYVLTVSVSVVAGVAAISSAVPSLSEHRVLISIIFVVFITVMNLRGVRESGILFAVPTYAFIGCIYLMLVGGFVTCLGGCPHAAPPDVPAEATIGGVSLFLLLRAFSSGSTALTGVEAISNGVPAFRKPQARNAAQTLAIMGVISVTMFLGISYFARAFQVIPITEEMVDQGIAYKTVVAQIAQTIFGNGALFYVIQTATAMILILAANTAYQDFPRLASILARDRYMPRQFMNRGDRLVFSNGVVALAILASILIWIFDAQVTRLIQLYVLGVFTSFTLSQTGMVRHWLKTKEKGWKRSAVINGIGAVATAVVLVVVTSTKLTHGAWIVVIAIPLIVLGFRSINRHYESVARQLRRRSDRPRPLIGTRAIVLVSDASGAAMRALGYARALRPREVRAFYVGPRADADRVRTIWNERRIAAQLDIQAAEGDLVDRVRAYIRAIEREGDEFVTVVVPETIKSGGIRQYVTGRKELMLKAAMLFESQVVLTDVPSPPEGESGDRDAGPIAPTRNVALVLVSAVHNATLRALEYANAIDPTEVRAVTFNVDERETRKVMTEWAQMGIDASLEVLDSPYREVARPLVKLVRQIRASSPGTVVTVIVPEFVVREWWHQFLHNQTALGIKAALLFEPGVVVTSVPYHLT